MNWFCFSSCFQASVSLSGQAGLKLMILCFKLPSGWDYVCTSMHQAPQINILLNAFYYSKIHLFSDRGE